MFERVLRLASCIFFMHCKISYMKTYAGVLKDFANFSGKHLHWKTPAMQALRLATLLRRDSNTSVFL